LKRIKLGLEFKSTPARRIKDYLDAARKGGGGLVLPGFGGLSEQGR